MLHISVIGEFMQLFNFGVSILKNKDMIVIAVPSPNKKKIDTKEIVLKEIKKQLEKKYGIIK